MALSPNRHIDGAGLLECIMRIPSDIAYRFFQDAPSWFYEEVAVFFQECGNFIPAVMPFVETDILKSPTSKQQLFTASKTCCANVSRSKFVS